MFSFFFSSLYDIIHAEKSKYSKFPLGFRFVIEERRKKKGEGSTDQKHRLKLTHDISLGVAYLHSLVPPVIHRDLKSLNLVFCFLFSSFPYQNNTNIYLPNKQLVDSNWLVKVADFGLSKIKDYYEETSSIVGTPAWTAPEVLFPHKKPFFFAFFKIIFLGSQGGKI